MIPIPPIIFNKTVHHLSSQMISQTHLPKPKKIPHHPLDFVSYTRFTIQGNEFHQTNVLRGLSVNKGINNLKFNTQYGKL